MGSDTPNFLLNDPNKDYSPTTNFVLCSEHSQSTMSPNGLRRRHASISTKVEEKERSPHRSKDPLRQTFIRKPSSTAVWITSARADAFLAAAGVATSLAFLHFVDSLLPIEFSLSASFHTSSAIKFFFNRNPPNLRAVALTSLVGIIIGSSLHFLIPITTTGPNYTNDIVIFLHMLYWKLSGNMWGAANNLSMYLVMSSKEWRESIEKYPLIYIIVPYTFGHLFLYVMALLLSPIRNRVRVRLLQREFFTVEANYLKTLSPQEQTIRIRGLFDRMDLSGEGRLDAIAFQSAIQAASGERITMDDATRMLKSVDTDGDGSLSFYEFCQAMNDVIIH